MPMTTLDIVVLIFSIPLWLFHLSMIYFLIRKIKSNSKEYYSGFFILFIILGVIDAIYFVVGMVGVNFPDFGLFFDFFQSSYAVPFHAFVCAITGFFQYFEYIAHTLISFNRFTTFCWKTMHERLWEGKPLIFVIFTLFFIPAAMISYRIVNPVTVTIVNGTFDVGYYEPIMSIAVLAGTVISFATTGIELVLEICTGFALMFFTKSIINKESNLNRIKNEIRLFVYSLVIFLFHGFLTAYYLSKYISTLGNSAMFNAIGEHLADIVRVMYMLANSLLLFLISNFVRKGYMEFYKISIKKKESTSLFLVNGNRNASTRTIQTSAVEPR